MTQHEYLAALREANPGRRLAASKDGESIGVWVEQWGRFAVAASRAITGQWVRLPFEVLANGQPPYGAGDWEE